MLGCESKHLYVLSKGKTLLKNSECNHFSNSFHSKCSCSICSILQCTYAAYTAMRLAFLIDRRNIKKKRDTETPQCDGVTECLGNTNKRPKPGALYRDEKKK